MGDYENQYRALEREGDSTKSKIDITDKEIKQSEIELKECQKQLASLENKRQKLITQLNQQQSNENSQDNSSQINNQIKQIDSQLNLLGDQMTFLTGKISSLNTKLSEAESKLGEIVSKLSTLKTKVIKEGKDFDSSFQGIKSEASQLVSKDSSGARKELSNAANKANSMHQKRKVNEKEINSIINKYKRGSGKTSDVQNYSGGFIIKPEPNKHPLFSNIPITSIKRSSKSIDDKFSVEENDTLVMKILPSGSLKQYKIPGTEETAAPNNNHGEEYYFYKKNRPQTNFNPYYQPYTKSILNNHYIKYDYNK